MTTLLLYAPTDSIAHRSLLGAVEARNRRINGSGERFDVRVIDHEQPSTSSPEAAVAFASLTESSLYMRSAKGGIVPGPRLVRARNVVSCEAPVVAVIDASKQLTGPEVAGVLLAGFASVVDDRNLLDDRVLEACIAVARSHGRANHLYGLPSDVTTAHARMLDEWEEELLERSLDLSICWKTCLASAQLDVLSPSPGGGYGFEDLARGLIMAEPITGFRLNDVDVRKTLSPITLFCGLDTFGKGARRDIPRRLRELGFPKFPPALDGKSFMETARQLFQVLRGSELKCLPSIGGCSHVSLEPQIRKHTENT